MPPPSIPILRYSTEDLPPEGRYEAWLKRDWPRTGPVYRTVPTEPFNIVMESAALGQTLFVRTEVTAMTWERRAQDIRDSDYQPIIVNMMIEGSAHGDMDGRPFLEPSGTYHFHDLARPSLHGSTASLTYSLILPRDVARSWLAPVDRLHGLVIEGDAAAAVMELARTFWRLLPALTPDGAARFERAFLELLAVGVEQAAPTPPARTRAEDGVRAAAIEAIDHRLGLQTVSAAKLAQVLKMPIDKLSLAFRGDGGVAAYLLRRRLEAAHAALSEVERVEPIGSIAHRLGFSDAAHLSRAFRERFGLSPSAFRKMGEGNVP